MNEKDIVRANRKAAVRNMAMRKAGRAEGEPTDAEIAEAATLYNSCIRWAHRKVNFVVTETEWTYDSPRRVHEEKLIEAKYDRLNGQLHQYGLYMRIPHLWARLYDATAGAPGVETDVQLHYFN